MQAGEYNAITDVPGVKLGQVDDPEALTGVSVVLVEDGAVGAVDVRGSNPGTFHTDALHPLNLNESVQAIVLAGGSTRGLEAMAGVMRWLTEHGFGVETAAGKVPVVSGAVIFDLAVGDPRAHPTREWGCRAAAAAVRGPVRQGNCGGGTGGTTGKQARGIPTKGGTGTASAVLPNGVVVGAITCVNALGDVIHPGTRELYAWSGFRDLPVQDRLWRPPTPPDPTDSTTIACVATNARLTKTQLAKVAQMAHQGLARAIRPIHAMRDGDAVFALSVGGDARIPAGGDTPGEDTDIIGAAAADVLMLSVVNAILAAEGIPGFPSYQDYRRRWGCARA